MPSWEQFPVNAMIFSRTHGDLMKQTNVGLRRCSCLQSVTGGFTVTCVYAAGVCFVLSLRMEAHSNLCADNSASLLGVMPKMQILHLICSPISQYSLWFHYKNMWEEELSVMIYKFLCTAALWCMKSFSFTAAAASIGPSAGSWTRLLINLRCVIVAGPRCRYAQPSVFTFIKLYANDTSLLQSSPVQEHTQQRCLAHGCIYVLHTYTS